MGIIKATLSAISGSLGDQWLEVLEADDMGGSTVFTSAKAVREGKGSNTKGVECCVYSVNTEAGRVANKICDNIAALGFTNRGIKARTDLGVLKGITNGGNNILVECFFCDDEIEIIKPPAVDSAAAIAPAATSPITNTPRFAISGVAITTISLAILSSSH